MELSSEEKFDRAMKLSQRTGVSLEDAKAALNACDFDMLDAVVYLEKLGKTAAPHYTDYTTTGNTGSVRTDYTDEEEHKSKRVTFGDLMGRFFKWIGKVIKIGNENFLDVRRNDEDIIHFLRREMLDFTAFPVFFVSNLLLVQRKKYYFNRAMVSRNCSIVL